jgi:hypothetical protein
MEQENFKNTFVFCCHFEMPPTYSLLLIPDTQVVERLREEKKVALLAEVGGGAWSQFKRQQKRMVIGT